VFGSVLAKGGRNAMAGPVYYTADYPADSKVKFPEHYNGKFFHYDWMRDHILPVTMNAAGDYLSAEKFLKQGTFSHPIDMEFGPDGSLYVLEYGQNWFANNQDSGLNRITYNAGNRKPAIVSTISKKVGAAPLIIKVDASNSTDPDSDSLTYTWNFGNTQKAKLPQASATYTKPGTYTVTLQVKDSKGLVAEEKHTILVGNEAPTVEVKVQGNQSFYWEGEPINYSVTVKDKEDGSTLDKRIKPSDVHVETNFLEGYDKTIIAQGHQANTSVSAGKRLIELSDCKACHATKTASIGPSYEAISKKYRYGNQNIAMLSDKIIKGGAGNWGEQPMSAHPQLSNEDTREMVKYILSLNDPKKQSKPLKGTEPTLKKEKDGVYIVSGVYTDKGFRGLPPQKGSGSIVLRKANMQAVNYTTNKQTMNYTIPKVGDALIMLGSDSYSMYQGVDLTGIKSLEVNATVGDAHPAGGELVVRVGSPTGTEIGRINVPIGTLSASKIVLKPTIGKQNLYLVGVNPTNNGKPLFAITTINFNK
jgi:cytochrome c